MSRRIDTLFSGALFHTLRTEDETFRFLGETGGKITWLSDTRPENIHCKKEIQLNGMHVYPSFTDAHLHLMYSIAVSALGFHICEIRKNGVVPDTVEGAGIRLRDYCASRGADDIIVANSYVISAIKEKRMPTRHEIDAWTDGRRAIIYSIDGHSSSMSTAMLRSLDINPEGHEGVLQGVEHDFRLGRITELIIDSVGIRDIVRGIAAFINQCARYGITRVCAFDGNGDARSDTLMKLLQVIAPRMDIDVFLYPQYMDIERARPLWKKTAQPRIGGCGQWQMDGSVGSHSAAFYAPYSDTGKRTECYYTQAHVDETVKKAHEEGCQIASHAIGDAAIDRILAAYEKLGNGTLHRIEHCEFPTDEAVEKIIANGNIALAVQPGFVWIDARYLKTYINHLPPEAIMHQVPLKRLYNAGITLCASSDSPVQNLDPFLQMLGMIDFSVPGESLTNYEALRCYTVHPARIMGQETRFGVLELGKEASFFTTETDLIRASLEALPETIVTHTFIRGKELGRKKGTLSELLCLLLRRTRKI
jgi:predicted amidohydrolase YtcJ